MSAQRHGAKPLAQFRPLSDTAGGGYSDTALTAGVPEEPVRAAPTQYVPEDAASGWLCSGNVSVAAHLSGRGARGDVP